MRAYFNEQVDRKDQLKIRQKIAALPEVKEVKLVDKEEAWRQFQTQYRSMDFKQWAFRTFAWGLD